MTVSSAVRKAGPFAGNNLATTFPFNFKVFAKGDIKVLRVSPSGVSTTLTLDSDYSVQLNTDQDGQPGGWVTYPISGDPLPIDYQLVMLGNLPYDQETDLTNSGGFYPQTVEDMSDRSTIQIQQLAETMSRAIVISEAESTSPTLPNSQARANTVVGFDALGNLELYPATPSIGAGDLKNEVWTSGADYTEGVSNTLPLSRKYGTKANLGTVVMQGIAQDPDSYTLSADGTSLVFDAVIPVGTKKVWCLGGTTLSIDIPPDGSVTTPKLADDAVTADKLGGDADAINAKLGLTKDVGNIAALRGVSKHLFSRANTWGYYVAGDQGHGSYALDPDDTTTADNGGTVIVAADGGRWKLLVQDAVKARQFGMCFDGATDDTAALNNAIANCANAKLRFPGGATVLNGTVNIAVNNFRLEGEYLFATTVYSKNVTDTLFNITGSDIRIEHLNVVHSVTKTGGWTFNFESGNSHVLQDVKLFGPFAGVNASTTLCEIRNCFFQNITPGVGSGIVVGATGSGFNQLIDSVIMDNTFGAQPAFGIVVQQTNDLRIQSTEIQHCGTGLLIQPKAGQLAYAVYSLHSFFDSNSGRGVSIAPQTGGGVELIRFTSCWMGNNGSHGCEITAAAGGTAIGSIHFIDPHCINNQGDGVLASAGDDVNITGGVFSQNENGAHIGPGVSNFSITNGSYGNFGGGGGNRSVGIRIDGGGGTGNFIVMGNNIRGNALGALVDGSGAATKYIHHNLGVGD